MKYIKMYLLLLVFCGAQICSFSRAKSPLFVPQDTRESFQQQVDMRRSTDSENLEHIEKKLIAYAKTTKNIYSLLAINELISYIENPTRRNEQITTNKDDQKTKTLQIGPPTKIITQTVAPQENMTTTLKASGVDLIIENFRIDSIKNNPGDKILQDSNYAYFIVDIKNQGDQELDFVDKQSTRLLIVCADKEPVMSAKELVVAENIPYITNYEDINAGKTARSIPLKTRYQPDLFENLGIKTLYCEINPQHDLPDETNRSNNTFTYRFEVID